MALRPGLTTGLPLSSRPRGSAQQIFHHPCGDLTATAGKDGFHRRPGGQVVAPPVSKLKLRSQIGRGQILVDKLGIYHLSPAE